MATPRINERLILVGTATRKQGLTLYELTEYVKRAQDKGVDPDTLLTVTTTWRGRIQTIKVDL